MKHQSLKTISQAIYESTKDKEGTDLSHALDNVVSYLTKHQLISSSKEILNHLEKIIDRESGIVRARITSRVPLEKTMLHQLTENLKKKYSAHDVAIEEIKDTTILGGIKIEVGEEVMDFTLSHKLHQLQNYLITH